jgi:pimeloyl-ACP methyl ester carboxylesterase
MLSMNPMSVDRYAVLDPARHIAANVMCHQVTQMTHSAISLILVLSSVCSAQTTDTLTVKYSESKYDSTLYRTSHIQFISDSACKLAGVPIWICHGKDDEIVDVKETYRIAERLDQCNVTYSLSIFDGHKHWQTQWEVYGEHKI